MKKRLPNLSSAVILSLLSYLAQSSTGRCQSGRMSTPGKCVYRKPVPRVRIPPCPPSIFYRNVFVMSILRFSFVRTWGRNGENIMPHLPFSARKIILLLRGIRRYLSERISKERNFPLFLFFWIRNFGFRFFRRRA